MYTTLRRRLLVAAAALTLGAGSALAQDRHELLEEDVELLRQVLPARVALVRWRAAHGRNLQREMNEVASFPLVPPGARYDAQCSLELSGNNSAVEATTKMVFTFPSAQTDSEILEQATGALATGDLARDLVRGMNLGQAFEALGNVQSAATAQADSRTGPLHNWYRAQGFRRHPTDHNDEGLYKAARDGLKIRAEISNTNSMFREMYCMHLHGPMVVIERESSDLEAWERDKQLIRRLSSIPPDPEPGDEQPAKSEAQETYEVALHEAGMTDEVLEDLLEIIFTVRRFLASTPGAQAVWRNSLSELWRERLDASVEWYRRHGSTIAPLLAELHGAYYHPARSATERP